MGKSKPVDKPKEMAKASKSGKNSEQPKKRAPNSAAVSKEIDDLFGSVLKKSSKKREPSEDDENDEDEKDESEKKIRPKHRSSNEPTYGVMKTTHGGDIVNPEAPLERIDAESGLPVYKAHLLKVGEGGGTPLCPFDCNCCF